MRFPSRTVTVVALLIAGTGCGPYRIRYTMPSKPPTNLVTSRDHAHGIGLIGGGLYFFALHQMFPALVDYTGPVDVASECPNGFTEISHHHEFEHNTLAAFLSWLVLLNVYHKSTVEFHHAAATTAASTKSAP